MQYINVIDANLLLLDTKRQQARELIDHIEQNKPYSKELDRLMMEVYYHRDYKTFIKAAFELLKQPGFGIIQHDQLRNGITKHYTTDLADINSILNRLESLNLLQVENIYWNFKNLQ